MEQTTLMTIDILDERGIAEARRMGREFLKQLAFRLIDQSRIITAISELARNIFNYALPGKIFLEVISRGRKTGLKLTAADEGPGIEDVSKALECGFTTSGGLGAGLPGVRSLMDEFSCTSRAGIGTTITAIKWLK
ncbi:ATP-binding protein [Planococcus lenghuensis]|uniref:ATP-binding protein n=2 Tax=Planococcus lenghuensis TaxID=2213202 RepID=A0A1Q2L4X7_9BACL|nr:ATP-binding protein [Planococcus lenghuensis]